MAPTGWEIFADDIYDKEFSKNTQFNIFKKSNLKINKGPQYPFFQRRDLDGQQAHEKLSNIANHQGNANQNHSEISPYTYQIGYY